MEKSREFSVTDSAVEFDPAKTKVSGQTSCEDCARSKVGCDKSMPSCRNCTKRLIRCVYPVNAREAMSVKSLNDRLLLVEHAFAVSPAYVNPIRDALTPGSPVAYRHSGSSLMIPQDMFQSLLLKDMGIELPALEYRASIPSAAPLKSSSVHLLPPLSAYFSEPTAKEDVPSPLFSSTSNSSLNAPEAKGPPMVTSALLALLPKADARPRLLDLVGEVLAIGPVGALMGTQGWTRTRNRIERLANGDSVVASRPLTAIPPMMAPAPSGKKRGRSEDVEEDEPVTRKRAATNPFPSSDSFRTFATGTSPNSESPTITLFAIAAAVFAIGRLVAAESSKDPDTTREEWRVDAHRLLEISHQSLSVYDSSLECLESAYTNDYISAQIVQAVALIRMRRMLTLLPLIGKMVNVARFMGLSDDPKTRGGTDKHDLRRRLWWDVVYYDLFVSDYLEQLPLIADGSFSTRVPEILQADPTSTFYQLKCQLAQLVRTVKSRRNRNPYTLIIAGSCEAAVSLFLNRLPTQWHLDESHGISATDDSAPILLADSTETAANQLDTSSPISIAQSAELATLAGRLLFNAYLPFVEPQHSGKTTPSQVTLGMVTAAHLVILASHTLQEVWIKHESGGFSVKPVPESLLLHSLPRQILEASIVSGHGVVVASTSLWVKEAIKDCTKGLEVLGNACVGGEDVKTSAAYQLLKKVKLQAVAIQRTRRKPMTTQAVDVIDEEDEEEEDTPLLLAPLVPLPPPAKKPGKKKGTAASKAGQTKDTPGPPPQKKKTKATPPAKVAAAIASPGTPKTGLRSRPATPRAPPTVVEGNESAMSVDGMGMDFSMFNDPPSSNPYTSQPNDLATGATGAFLIPLSNTASFTFSSQQQQHAQQFPAAQLMQGRPRAATHSGHYGGQASYPTYGGQQQYATQQDDATISAQKEVMRRAQYNQRSQAQSSQPTQNFGAFNQSDYPPLQPMTDLMAATASGSMNVPLMSPAPSYGAGFAPSSSSMDYYDPQQQQQMQQFSGNGNQQRPAHARHHSDMGPPSSFVQGSSFESLGSAFGGGGSSSGTSGAMVPNPSSSLNPGEEWAALQGEGFSYY